MSQENKKPQGHKEAPLVAEVCKFEECKSKSKKFGFCSEHYEMYMAGVVRGDGRKPTDFSEKLAHYHKSHRKVA